jgi:hypothetical protein
MDAATVARFAEIDEHIGETDRRLATIARPNASLGEMVELLGGSVDGVQHHIEDDH